MMKKEKYDILCFYSEECPVYIVLPRLSTVEALMLMPRILSIDFDKDQSLCNVLDRLYRLGFRFVPKKKRAKNDKEYDKEKNTCKYDNTAFLDDFLTRLYSSDVL